MFKCILAFDYVGVKKELVLELPLTEPNSSHINLIFGMYLDLGGKFGILIFFDFRKKM